MASRKVKQIRSDISECDTRNEGISRFIRNPSSVLTIPRLSSNDVKTKFSAGNNLQYWARLALNLMSHGYVDKNDKEEDTILIAKRGVQKWVAAYSSDLTLFDLTLSLAAETNIEDINYQLDMDAVKENLNEIYGEFNLMLGISGDAKCFSIGKKLQEIEDSIPGLGQTAYYWLATAGARNLEVFTPWLGESYGPHVWWMGNDNQEDWVAEISSMYDDDEDFNINDHIGPDDYAKAFPTWVIKINNPLSEADLLEIASQGNGNLESQVASAVIEIIKNQGALLPDARLFDLECAYSGMYLFWEVGDASNRLVDDRIQMINEYGGEGFTEELCIEPIPENPFKFKKWIRDMEKGLIQLKNIERLVTLIGVSQF